MVGNYTRLVHLAEEKVSTKNHLLLCCWGVFGGFFRAFILLEF